MSEPATVPRAFELPVQAVDPPEARDVIRRCGDEAAGVMNWCARYLYRWDVDVTPDLEQLPAYPSLAGVAPLTMLTRRAGETPRLMRRLARR